ncbi:MAG: hypothetical protein HQK93_08345 [Nitrospirae bacterium]|nr:hypothetical protein [Nitrospirota bacterium]
MFNEFNHNIEIFLRLKYPVGILKRLFFKFVSTLRVTPRDYIVLKFFGIKMIGNPAKSVIADTIYKYHSHELIVTEFIKRIIKKT